MLLPADTAAAVALAGAGVGVGGLLLATAAHLRLRRLLRRIGVLTDGVEGIDVLTAMDAHTREVEALREQVADAQVALAQARSDVADALRHVALVRYDAFPDMGGRLSYSAALLDDAGDGIVLSAINGRSETRTYAKGIKAGRSVHTLSPEETQAVAYALRGAGSVTPGSDGGGNEFEADETASDVTVIPA